MNQLLKFKQEAIYMDCCLNELGTFYGGLSGKTKEHFGTGDAKFVTYMNVFSNCIARKDQCECVLISDDEKQNLVKKGDILFTQSSETPEEVGMASIWTHDLDVYLNSFCFGFRVLDPKKTNPLYLTYLLRSPKYRQAISIEAQGISRYNLSSSRLSSLKLRLHSCEEQQKIAEFFTELDEKIRIAENQLELFESAYKALMAQVFLKNNNEGIWQTIKLKDICKRVTRKNTDNRCDIPLTISSADGLVNQLNYFSKKIASKDMSKYYLLKRGEFAYNKSYSSGYDFGSIKRLKLFDEGALSTLYICFSIDCVNNEYMEYYFDSLSWYKNISKLCGEGARNHGLLNIGTSDFFDMELTIHKSPVDQEKIVNLFSCFSKKVSTLKQRVLLYKQLKKAFMQRMFV